MAEVYKFPCTLRINSNFQYSSQEEKFKIYNSELQWTLNEYDSIVADVIPVTAMILVSSIHQGGVD